MAREGMLCRAGILVTGRRGWLREALQGGVRRERGRTTGSSTSLVSSPSATGAAAPCGRGAMLYMLGGEGGEVVSTVGMRLQLGGGFVGFGFRGRRALRARGGAGHACGRGQRVRQLHGCAVRALRRGRVVRLRGCLCGNRGGAVRPPASLLVGGGPRARACGRGAACTGPVSGCVCRVRGQAPGACARLFGHDCLQACRVGGVAV